MSVLVEGAQLVSALAAVGAVTMAAIQIRGLRADATEARANEIVGVSVQTVVVHRPARSDVRDGLSDWKYAFTVHNPGRFPITHVRVVVDFDIPIRRKHYDGSIDASDSQLEMSAPVVAARGEASWNRTVVVEHARRALLRQTQICITFVTQDGGEFESSWPPKYSIPAANRRLARVLTSLATNSRRVADSSIRET